MNVMIRRVKPRIVAIPAEIKTPDERRTVLGPKGAAELLRMGARVVVAIDPKRVFSAEEYEAVSYNGKRVEMVPEISPLKPDFIFGVKEVHPLLYRPGEVVTCFSHTIKGQPNGMPLLAGAMEKKITLLDYERIGKLSEDGNVMRTVAFGRHAGINGMNDSLRLLFLRLAALGHKGLPVKDVKQAIDCEGGIAQIFEQAGGIAEAIKKKRMPQSAGPLVVGVLGYGKVSRGMIEVLDAMSATRLSPQELLEKSKNGDLKRSRTYYVVFEEKDTVVPKDSEKEFDLDDYHNNPKASELYVSQMEQYLPHLTMLMNGILWFPRQPRLCSSNVIMSGLGNVKMSGSL